MGITVMGEHEVLSENPTADEVVGFMKNSTSEDDWNNRIDEVQAKFGGHYPDFWYEKIVVAGIRPNKKNVSSDIEVVTFDDFKKVLNPIEELGKKDEIESTIDDFKETTIYGRPKEIPSLMSGYKFICGYDQGLGQKLFVCNTLEGAQALYDKYAQGWAVYITRYTGKIKE